MRILFIAGTLGTGGAEKQLFKISKALKEKGVKVAIFSFTQGEYYEFKLKQNEIEVFSFQGSESKLNRLRRLFLACLSFKPNLIFGFHFFTNFYAALVGYLFKVKSIGSVRGSGIAEKKNNGIVSWLHYSLPSKIFVNSENARKNLDDIFYRRNNYLLNNIIDVFYFDLKHKDVDSETLKLLFIGRFENIKNPLGFLELFEDMNLKQGVRVVGTMLGHGPLKSRLQEVVISKGVPVRVLDFDENIYPYFMEADILISTSFSEGSPNVILEALSTGLHVCALQNHCYSGLENLGLISTFDSIYEMREFVVNFRKSDFDGNKGREHIINYHSEAMVINDLIEELNKLC